MYVGEAVTCMFCTLLIANKKERRENRFVGIGVNVYILSEVRITRNVALLIFTFSVKCLHCRAQLSLRRIALQQ